MKKLSLLTTCLLTIFFAQAQTDSTTTGKQKTFNVSIRTMENKKINGRLIAVNDSQLVMAKSLNAPYPVPSENIKSFTLKRKNGTLRGALIGFGIGAFTGIVTGLIGGDDPPEQWFAMTAGEKAMAGGLLLGATGALVGTIVGAVAQKKFTIGGKKEKFRDLQAEIMIRLVKK